MGLCIPSCRLGLVTCEITAQKGSGEMMPGSFLRTVKIERLPLFHGVHESNV